MRELENSGYTKSGSADDLCLPPQKDAGLLPDIRLLTLAEICTAVVQYQSGRDYSPAFDVNIVVSTRGISVFGVSVVQDIE